MMALHQYYNLVKYAGQDINIVNNLPWGGSEDSFLAGASPAAADGNIMAFQQYTSPDNYLLVVSSTGVPTVFSGGSTARQSTYFDLYRVATRSWDGAVTDYINDQAPVINYTGDINIFYQLGLAISDIDFKLYVTDPEGDSFTVTTASLLPTGLSLVGGVLTGTPSGTGVFPISLVATDILGEASTFPLITITIFNTVSVPNVIGNDEATAIATITGVGLTTTTITQSSASPAGTVLAQSPAGGAVATIGSNVQLTIATSSNVVPNVISQSESTGVAAISLAGYRPQPLPPEHSPSVPTGFIVSQAPPAGTAAVPGTDVDYVVSLGPETPPTPPSPTGNAFYVGRVIFGPTISGVIEMVTFDFLKDLSAGESLTSAVVSATVYSGVDASPSAILIGNSAIVGSAVNQKVEGGVTGVIYELLCVVTTSLSQTLKLAAYYAVQTDLP